MAFFLLYKLFTLTFNKPGTRKTLGKLAKGIVNEAYVVEVQETNLGCGRFCSSVEERYLLKV